MHHPTDRIIHTTGLCYTSRGALAGTRNNSMGPPHEGSIQRPIAPSANALTMKLHLFLFFTGSLNVCSSLVILSSHTLNIRRFNGFTDGKSVLDTSIPIGLGARCSFVVRAFAHGAMGRRIDPSWGEPIELFLIPASAPRLV